MIFSLSEALRFSRILTWRRVWNIILTYSSFYISQMMGRPIVPHRPFTLSFEPTTQCNLGCPECPSGLKSFTRDTGNASLELYESIIRQAAPDLIFLYLYFQGEPLIHKGFSDMVAIAKKYNIYTITSTNAHYLTPNKAEEIVKSGLDRILISIDGATQETYEQYRIHGQLTKVIAGTKNLIEARQCLNSTQPEIIMQMLVVRPNEHEVDEVEKIRKELGADRLILKTAQIYDFEHGHVLMPVNPIYSRYQQQADGRFRIKNEMKNQCWKLWHSAVVTWDGRMIPCCFDKDASYTMGNLGDQTLEAVWTNDSYQNFRKQLLHSRAQIDICQNCSEGTKIWETV